MILTDAQVRARIDRGERYDGIVLGPNQHLAIDSSWPGSYGNHSCDPNLWMRDAITIGTRRRVAAGEGADGRLRGVYRDRRLVDAVPLRQPVVSRRGHWW